MAFLLKSYSKVVHGKQLFKVYCLKEQQLQRQNFKTAAVTYSPNKEVPKTTHRRDSNNEQKKPHQSPKITLIQNQTMTVTALEEAKNLAKRRSMHLIKVQDMDPKTQRPVYKLLTAAEMLQNELSDMKKSAPAGDETVRATNKSEKSLSIGSRIAEHDLSSRLKNISKWLNRQHEVRILIQATSAKDLVNCEKLFKTIEETVTTPQVIGKIAQKRTKGNMIKFSILPVKEEKIVNNSQ